jgi:MoxR-like ATPase
MESEKVTLSQLRDALQKSMTGHLVALESQLDQLLIAWLVGGHCLLTGIAGSAKSSLVKEFAARLELEHQWISMTSQLGSFDLVTDPMRRANVLLIENVNRCGEEIRAALLDVVSHGSVPLGDEVFEFADPLMVVATTNRLETDTDKFLFEIQTDYPDYESEYSLLTRCCSAVDAVSDEVSFNWNVDLASLRQEIQDVAVPPQVVHFVLRLIRGTRLDDGDIHDFAVEWLVSGAGPRASENLMRTARALAAIKGRNVVQHQDVKELIHPILRHRIVRNQNAIDNEVSVDKIIDRLLYEIDDRVDGDDRAPGA